MDGIGLARQGAIPAIGATIGVVLLMLVLGVAPAQATTLPSGFSEATLTSGFNAPVGIAWAPDGRGFVAEKGGRVRVVNPDGTLRSTPLLDIRSQVNSYSDRGLLGIATDRDFAINGYLYLLYVYELNPLMPDTDAPMVARLTRVTVKSDNTLENPSSPETVILGRDVSGPCPNPDNSRDCIPADYKWHVIGTVRSDPTDGTLWVGVGDTNPHSITPNSYRPYDPETFAGKILHVDRQGRGLPNHPYCPSDNDLTHTCTKVYASGFRNPYRFTLRPGKGPVVGDVGAGDEEEIDLIQPGKNYGWPCYEGAIRTPLYDQESRCQQEYAKEGTPDAATPPSWRYAHGGGATVIAGPTYTGSTYPADFRGDVFVGDYVQGWVKRLEVDAQDRVTQVHDFGTGWPTGVSLDQAPNDNVAYVDIGFGGGQSAIREFRFNGGNSPPTARASAAPTSGDPPLDVQLTGSDSSDPDGDSLTYDWDFGDGSAHSSAANPTHTYADAGVYDARLTVDDGNGNTDSDTVTVTVGGDAPPTARIDAPADESTYRGGERVDLSGSGTDREDGAIPSSGLSWHVLLHHGSHVHEVGTFDGAQASFVPHTDHDADSFYEIRLTATDSAGSTDTKTIEVRPETSELTLASSPPGAPVEYSGVTAPAPVTKTSAVGFKATVNAADRFTYNGETYLFDRWSDGGSRQHEITVPPDDTTLTAHYEPQGEIETLRFTPDADTYVTSAEPTTPKGGSGGLNVDADPAQESLVRFPVSGINGRRVVGARLRMHEVDNSPEGGKVHSISPGAWSESTTWANRPAIGGPVLASFGPVSAGLWYEADLGSGAVPGDGPVAFALDTTNGDKSRFASSESTNPPELLIEVERGTGGGGDDGLSEVAGPSSGSANPTAFAGNRRVAETAGGRLLAVHGRSPSGVQLAWKDPGEDWRTETTGNAGGGVLSSGVSGFDLVASIAVARDSGGTEHAWVVWSSPRASSSKPQPVKMRRLSDLDSPSGPRVGPAVTVDSPQLGAWKADLAFERAPGGAPRGAVAYSRRTASSTYEIATTWFTNLDTDSPGFHDTTAVASSSSSTRFGSLVPTSIGMRLATRGSSTSSSLRVFTHLASDPLGNWSRSASGSSLSDSAYPTAAALPSGAVLVAAETDTGAHVVRVKRFSPSGGGVTNDLTLTGYAEPSIATEGDRAWLVMVRKSDGRVVSREMDPASGWSASDRVELDASAGGNHAWPNLVRDPDGRLRFVVRGPSGGTSSAVLAFDRSLDD